MQGQTVNRLLAHLTSSPLLDAVTYVERREDGMEDEPRTAYVRLKNTNSPDNYRRDRRGGLWIADYYLVADVTGEDVNDAAVHLVSLLESFTGGAVTALSVGVLSDAIYQSENSQLNRTDAQLLRIEFELATTHQCQNC